MPRALILNTDDDPGVRYARSRILCQAGFEVAEAATGREAIQSAIALKPSMVLLDIHLPDLSGFEVCRALKANAGTGSIPVLHISATALADVEQVHGLESSDGYLTEPVSPEVLVATIRMLLRTRTVEEALRRSEERFRVALRHTPTTLWTQDLDLRYTWAYNPSGFEPDELLGKTDSDLLPPGEAAELSAIKKRVLNTGASIRQEIRLGGRWFACSFEPLHDEEGLIAGLICASNEVTGYKETEAALRESEENLRVTMEALAVGAWSANLATGALTASRQARLLHGLDGEAPLEHETVLAQVHPEDRGMVVERLQQALRGGGGFEVEYRLSASGDLVRWLASRARIVTDPETGSRRLLGIVQDTTARKRTEHQLRRSNDDLQEFAYAVSHDLQEPLRTVTSCTNLLMRAWKQGEVPEDADQLVAFVTDAAGRMRTLINDLLAYSRIPQEEHASETAGMEGVLQLAQANLRESIRRSGAVITRDPLPEVTGDFTRLTQLVQNLLSNAIKYSQGPPSIHVSAAVREQEALFSVRDHGIGIDPQHSDRIFAPFKRLHGREYPGSGIGLAICKRIVERHHGRIWVESEPGAGSTFFFTLPLAATPLAASDVA